MMRRRWLLYGLMGLNVVVNALIPFMLLVSAVFLFILSRKPEYRLLSRIYGLAILGGAVLTIIAYLALGVGRHPAVHG